MRPDYRRLIILGTIVGVWALVACSRIFTVAEAVYIPGDAPVEHKLVVAEKISGEVWESGLTQRVRKAYPDLTDEQLSGVFLRWETITVTPVTGEGERQPSAGVRIRTGIQHRGGVKNARDIAKLCGDIVEQAVAHQFDTTDIYRIDLTEQSLAFQVFAASQAVAAGRPTHRRSSLAGLRGTVLPLPPSWTGS